MINKIPTYDPTLIATWNDNISTLAGNSIFHTSNWARVLSDTYQFTPLYFIRGKVDNPNFILPLMGVKSFLTGNRGVSLPFTDFCEPLNDDLYSSNDTLDSIVLFAKQQNWDSVQLRGGNQIFQEKVPSATYLNHVLKLGKTEEEIFCKFQSNLKRNIKKAEKQEIQIVLENSLKSLKAFYYLNCLTRKKHGLPPQPFNFFENILKHVIQQKLGSIFLAKYNNNTIAAAMYFHFNNKVLYKFGASDNKFQHLRSNNLIMWEAIKHYNKLGFQELDFGKTDISNEGLRRYKLSYDAIEQSLNYYKYNLKKNDFAKDKLKINGWYNKVFNKMPLLVLKTSGSVLYKHIA